MTSVHGCSPARASGRPGRWAARGVVLALALVLHALLLGVLPLGWGEGAVAGVRPVMQVRAIVLPPMMPAPAALPPQAQRGPSAPRPLPAAARVPRAAAEVAAAPGAVPSTPAAVAAGAAIAAVAEVAAVAAMPAAPGITGEAQLPAAASAAALDLGGQRVPTFATRMPPPMVLHYELRRGALRGLGELAWRPRAQAYSMSMTGHALGLPLLEWRSEGGFDDAGLAPARFVDRRRGRELRAANFQRDSGRITFSGPPLEYPLLPGAQDRLSWMVQLPAIIAAAPQRFAAGAQVPIFVVGARGDADLWAFSVEGVESLEVPAGVVAGALRLLRQPRKPYDTRVEVWLDPARHHLPVRILLAPAQAAEGNEFVLQRVTPAD